MDVVSLSSLRVGSIVWQPRSGACSLTIVCKATYKLMPVECPLDTEQEPVCEADSYWNDEDSRSLREASDLAPYKPRADVIVLGSAYAPRQQPVGSLIARLIVGDVDKSIEIFGERAWAQDGTLREGQRFTKMPLVWERAGGGPDTANPVGVRADTRPDRFGMVPLPNFQPPGRHVASPGEYIDPVGFGPIAPTWPQRMHKLYRSAAVFSHRGWHERPLPEIDPGYFNAAPPDQQLEALRPNERIVLEHLHPNEPRVVTSLKAISPRARVERRGGTEDLALRCDTLTIDTDRGRAYLVWRAQIMLERPDDAGRVLVGVDGETDQTAPVPARKRTVMQTLDARSISAAMSSALPFSGSNAPSTRNEPSLSSSWSGTAMPFVTPAPPPPSSSPQAAAPPAITPPPASSPAIAPPPVAPPPVAPPLVRAPDPIAPSFVASPWGAGDRGPETGRSIGQLAAQQPSPNEAPPKPQPATIGQASARASSESSSSLPAVSAPVAGIGAAAAGVVAASNAAAAASARAPSTPAAPAQGAQRSPRAPGAPRDVLDLLWWSPESPAKLRAVDPWKSLLAENAPKEPEKKADRGFDDDHDDEPPPPPPKETTDRRDVQAALARGEAIDEGGLIDAVSEAIDDDGAYDPPIVLLSGDLVFPFDEIEALKATITAATPLVGSDKKLKETVDAANEVLKTPGIQGSPGVTEGLTGRVKEAFNQANRVLPAGYLDAQTERVLLEQRHYQRRTVLGEPMIRALITPLGAQAAIPVYLPDPIAKKLPMFQRFRARVIAEVLMQQDQYETHACALSALAIGRILPAPTKR